MTRYEFKKLVLDNGGVYKILSPATADVIRTDMPHISGSYWENLMPKILFCMDWHDNEQDIWREPTL